MTVTVELDANSGIVTLTATVNGQPWRRAIMPHSVAELDEFAPDLSPEQRAAILADWAGRPVPVAED